MDTQTFAVRQLHPMNVARHSHASVAVQDSVFVISGFAENMWILNSVERYNHQTGQWANVAPLNVALSLVGAAVLNDVIYVVGGHGIIVECYVNGQDKWTPCTPMIEARRQPAVAALNGYLYVIGGLTNWAEDLLTMERFDPVTDTWSKVRIALFINHKMKPS